MSESPAETACDQSAGTGSKKGFRAFWRKDEKTETDQNHRFVKHDPLKKKQTNRISRFLRQSSSPKTGDGDKSEGSTKSDAKKRQQQVYQAQKRHRNRKADYVGSLEQEIARLQHLDSQTCNEKNVLAHENQAIRDLLAKRAIDVQLDALDLSAGAPSILPDDWLDQLDGAMIDVRYDAEISHERTFLDFHDLIWASTTTSPSQNTDSTSSRHLLRHAPVQGDSSAALDFILALEWVCQDHTPRPGISLDVDVAICGPEELDNSSGHALTITNAVYQRAMPPKHASPSASAQNWHLPHSEIDKLVALSEKLPLEDEQLTPAQAYSAVRETIPGDAWLRPALEAIRKPLASMAQCTGFGAFIPADLFWQHLDTTVQTLKATRPDLSQPYVDDGLDRDT